MPFLVSALNKRKSVADRDAAIVKAQQELRKSSARAAPAAAVPSAGPPAGFWEEALQLMRRSVDAQERLAESAEDIAAGVAKLAKKAEDEEGEEDDEGEEE